ncbi:MAG: DUF2892 domain-containing protein [Leptospiraceae bacterium]|nr:DUF2892 domain-containing protein [Leptospiraceae bacterium]
MFKASTESWYLERVLHLLGGIVILFSAGMTAMTQNTWWLLLAGLAGANLLVFALSGFCLMAAILSRCGIKSECQLAQKR